MRFTLKKIKLLNGEEVELESAHEADAQSLWEFGNSLAQDHEFQAMFPDEFTIKPESV